MTETGWMETSVGWLGEMSMLFLSKLSGTCRIVMSGRFQQLSASLYGLVHKKQEQR